ncbi:DUF3991 and TOPRIM domain-containing protein [Halospina sp. K52047b]|uniref:DUF3991 and TOPRIM domain-containing protein n=1 Tax=Halospina sp. K52047b TaxID=2614160 RepID=UPI001CE4243E|nr:DUF3991 and TOPRIM domain-containing protein [Halospina sp. K52047b]
MRENRANELNDFKREINLAEYAAAQGYQLDRRESSRNSAVMRRESDDDKIIIATDTDGHGIYFSVRDDQDNGSIIDFVQRRQGLNLGQTRKELRPWCGDSSSYRPLPIPERIRKPEPSNANRQAAMGSFAQMQSQPKGGHPRLQERGISSETLTDRRFAQVIRQDSRGNAVFPHYDEAGLSGYELKNRDFTGFSRGGEKRLWVTSNIEHAPRIVVTESAIDALSHAEITGDTEAAYISIGGQPSPEQWEALAAKLTEAQERGASVVIGTDADEPGDKLAARIEELTPGAKRDEPEQGKDWNQQLTDALDAGKEPGWKRHPGYDPNNPSLK